MIYICKDSVALQFATENFNWNVSVGGLYRLEVLELLEADAGPISSDMIFSVDWTIYFN